MTKRRPPQTAWHAEQQRLAQEQERRKRIKEQEKQRRGRVAENHEKEYFARIYAATTKVDDQNEGYQPHEGRARMARAAHGVVGLLRVQQGMPDGKRRLPPLTESCYARTAAEGGTSDEGFIMHDDGASVPGAGRCTRDWAGDGVGAGSSSGAGLLEAEQCPGLATASSFAASFASSMRAVDVDVAAGPGEARGPGHTGPAVDT